MKARVGWLARLCLVVYAAILVLLPLLWGLLGENYWPLILLRYMPAVVLVIPLLLFLAPQRERRVWLVSAGLLLLATFYYLGFQLPFRGTEDAPLTVITYNIKAGLEGPEEIGRFLAEQGVDIICLQEARPPIANPEVDPVDAVRAALPDYQMARGGIRGELVILSRHRILSMAERELANLSEALEVRIDVEGRELRVLNVHLMTGDPLKRLGKGDNRGRFAWLRVTAQTRHEQFEALSSLLAEDVATVLAGDFNTPPNSDGHALLSLDARDCFQWVGGGFGYTYPVRLPVWRIDYIWVTGLIAGSCRTLSSPLSDHRPLLARLRWAG